jgi:hypothetical protein
MARILVELDIHAELSEALDIFWHDQTVTQRLDYRGIPFVSRNVTKWAISSETAQKLQRRKNLKACIFVNYLERTLWGWAPSLRALLTI